MLFNSVEFLVFLPLVFLVYWAIQPLTRSPAGLKTQNALLLGEDVFTAGGTGVSVSHRVEHVVIAVVAVSTLRTPATYGWRCPWGSTSDFSGTSNTELFMASWVDAWGRLA